MYLFRREIAGLMCSGRSVKVEVIRGHRDDGLFDMPLGIMSTSAPVLGLWFSDFA